MRIRVRSPWLFSVVGVQALAVELLSAEVALHRPDQPQPAQLHLVRHGPLELYAAEDKPGNVPGRPFQRKRLLRAVDDNGKVLWEREMAAPIFLPPLP